MRDETKYRFYLFLFFLFFFKNLKTGEGFGSVGRAFAWHVWNPGFSLCSCKLGLVVATCEPSAEEVNLDCVARLRETLGPERTFEHWNSIATSSCLNLWWDTPGSFSTLMFNYLFIFKNVTLCVDGWVHLCHSACVEVKRRPLNPVSLPTTEPWGLNIRSGLVAEYLYLPSEPFHRPLLISNFYLFILRWGGGGT